MSRRITTSRCSSGSSAMARCTMRFLSRCSRSRSGVAVAAGGEHDAPKVRPPVTMYVEEHSATTDQLGPLHDPAGNVVLASLR